MKKIVIIGGGLAGLSAGVYGRLKGYEIEIYEMHDIAGGVCTGWHRKGYYFDGCIHWLVGTKEGEIFNDIWKELGVLDNKKIIDKYEICRLTVNGGKTYNIPTDLDGLKDLLLSITDNDKDRVLIDRFISDIKYLSENTSLPEKPFELMKIGDYMELGKKMGPFLKVMNKYKKFTVKEFTSKFANREVAFILSNIISIEDFPVFALMSTLGEYDKKNAGWPEGGALSFAGSLEKKYKDLGGKIFYKSKVNEIITGNGKASGIILENGSVIKGDVIISAADLHFTMQKLLKGKYKDYDRMFNKEKLWTPLVMAGIGINKEISYVPEADIRIGEFKFGDIPVEGVWIRNFGFDTSLNPSGKTSIIVSFESDFDFWQSLKSVQGKYENQKESIAKDIISYLEKTYPEIKGAIEVVDIATPLTTYRYTGNYKGSYEGWRYTKKNFGKNVRKFIPEIKNFYLCGQWVAPGGGIPAVAKCAKDVIEIIDNKVRKGRDLRSLTQLILD